MTTDASFTIRAKTLKGLIRNAAVTASEDYGRPLLTCAQFTVEKNQVVVDSTDSYTLLRQTQSGLDASEEGQFLIDMRLLTGWLGMCDRGELPATLTADDKTATLTCGDLTFTGPAMEGKYPDIDGLIVLPKDAAFERSAFNGAYLAGLAEIDPPSGPDRLEPWVCEHLNHVKASLFTRKAENWSATFAIMPVRTSRTGG